ncbi:methyltransferase family protein [Ruania halotolerans]|uniref:methyltransferase family protein n=1 Tax=Ruania halotolerans TaxID=2897773 RepID=UPI001E59CD3E|nr:isoprenylcysteine carboxylmethyltransferase family protein [Ruania halotolerans]UFU07478.1 isoprenylcysteine carboxylmethyltransferase family protein [Ruania halotolerans]
MNLREVHVPPPVVLLAAGLAQRALSRNAPRPGRWRQVASLALAAGSAALPVTAALTFISQRTTVSPLAPEHATSLITSGPNALTRNPMYLGMAGLLAAHAVQRGSWAAVGPLGLFVLTVDRWQIRGEEEALRRLFGAEYGAYCARVPRWLGRVR